MQRRKLLFFLLTPLAVIGLVFLIKVALALDQIKTNEYFVFQETAQISSGTLNKTFSVYIGDNISGVTNAVKSAYFIISGVYTGAGGANSIQLTINSDSGTLKGYTLPNVGATPMPFEILYKDEWNKIQPTSAGTYSYTLDITVTGVTVSTLGGELNLTYRYVPAACPDGSNQKIKTVESFVGISTVSFNSSIQRSFDIYIGDSLNGVTAPAIKSVYFTISGVYTGAGSIRFELDFVSGTSLTFQLPNAGTTPTPFEILYRDPSTPAPGRINPASNGTFSYTLRAYPTGITVYGFGAKITYTYRYAPPSCGGNPTGELFSAIFDTALDGAAYNSFLWKGTLNTGKVRLKIATSNVSTGPWAQSNYLGPEPTCSTATASDSDWYVLASDTPAPIGCASSHNNKRYFRYEVQLCKQSDCTTGTGTSPQVDDVVVSWSP